MNISDTSILNIVQIKFVECVASSFSSSKETHHFLDLAPNNIEVWNEIDEQRSTLYTCANEEMANTKPLVTGRKIN